VIPGLNDDQFIIRRPVGEPVLVVDPPGPEAGQVPAQGLRLANALKRRALGFFDQPEQAA